MLRQSRILVVAALAVLGALAGPAGADMPAAIYAPGTLGFAPEVVALPVWLLVVLPTAGCAAALLWLIWSDQRKAMRQRDARRSPAGNTVRLSF